MTCYGKIKCMFMFLHDMTLVLKFRFLRCAKTKQRADLKIPQAAKPFKPCKQDEIELIS